MTAKPATDKPKKKRGGRPSLCTSELTQQIAAHIMTGATYASACATVGVSYDSFNAWMNRGRVAFGKGTLAQAEQPYIAFYKAIRQSDAQAENGMASVVMAAALGNNETPPNWTAAAWWLERRRPRDYGKQINLDVRVRRFMDELEARGLEFDTIATEVLKAADDELAGHSAEGGETDAFSD